MSDVVLVDLVSEPARVVYADGSTVSVSRDAARSLAVLHLRRGWQERLDGAR